jgi:electron transport complex protein RnfG
MSSASPNAWWRGALLLAACALIAVALLDGIYRLGHSRIAAQERLAELAALAIVLPPSLHDNDPLTDRIRVRAPAWLGTSRDVSVWRARQRDAPAALVLEAIAPDGYAGPISLLVGIRADGSVSGVRVTAHRETPGLGDDIEAGKSDWILGFGGRSLSDPPRARWAVRRDGGAFDQLAGATVTPRAIVHAVRRALAYVERHGAALYAAPPGSLLEHSDAPHD